MQVTAHFWSEEWDCRDGTPYPHEWIEVRLRPLCETLEVVRAEWSRPLVITSGFRTVAWNERVGGQEGSRHLFGDACDFMVSGVGAETVYQRALELQETGLIHCGGLALYKQKVSFVHLDIRGRRIRWEGSPGQVPL